MTFHIESHRLTSAPSGFDLQYTADKVPGYRITPKVIVIHYGVTQTHRQLEQALLSNDYVSAHIALTARGDTQKVTQMVPFNIRGAHAGATAVYNGQPGVNSFSVGIEINNPGPVFRRNGRWEDIYGKEWAGDVWEEKVPRFPTWTAWAKYTQMEVATVTALCVALCAKYPIVDVVGHNEIRNDKADPGPAFPLADLRQFLFGRSGLAGT